jgi:hypothetical protein
MSITQDRTIIVPSSYVGTPDAILSLSTVDGEQATMTLTVNGETVAVGEGFRCPAAGSWTWLDCGDAQIVGTFGSFLAHAIESSDGDARNGWPVLTDDASDWSDALTLYGDEDYPPCPICGDPIDYCQGHGERNAESL